LKSREDQGGALLWSFLLPLLLAAGGDPRKAAVNRGLPSARAAGIQMRKDMTGRRDGMSKQGRDSYQGIGLVWWVAFAVFVIDQLSKIWVVHVMDLATRLSVDVLPPYLNFRMAWNYGINFGLLAGDAPQTRWILISVALGIVLFVTVWMRRDPPGLLGLISGGMLIGGALGNVLDRVLYGAVADFLNMSCCGIDNPFAFNIADIAIFAGAFGLVLFPGGKKGA
jgi:signal peptidase II